MPKSTNILTGPAVADALSGEPPQLLLKPEQAATALNIGKRKLWELTNRKMIPHVRIGRSVRYPVDDLRAWIEEQTIAA